jgi:hypothetical protein
MRKSLPLILILLFLAVAPGCCVLELHPIPWMAGDKASPAVPIDNEHAQPTLVNVADR